MPRWLLVLAFALMASGAAGARRHEVHVSHARLVLDGAQAVARIRWFRDDLERALGRTMAATPQSRAALTAYLASHFRVRADGVALSCRIEDDAAEQDSNGEAMWWAVILCDAAKDIRTLGLTNTVLFDNFRDQQNLVVVIKAANDERRSLYFQGGDRREQLVTF